MKRAAFGVIQGAVAVLSLSSLAYGQQPIPCKYFSLVDKASVESIGGLITLQVRSDPGQSLREKRADFAAKCEMALETPAPWLTIIDHTPLDDKGYSKVTLRADANNVPVARTARLTIGTSGTATPGAGPNPANTIVMIEQSAGAHPDANPVVGGGAIVNNASFVAQVSPGSLFSIFGNNLATSTQSFPVPFPYSYGGTTVSISGTLCPLIYVSPTLINAQFPANIGTGTATVTVTVNGATGSNTVQVVPASPGIFMLSDGVTAIVQHSNGSVASSSNPANASEAVAFYGTGIGPLAPSLSTDQIAGGAGNLSTAATACSVQINGATVEVDYCGMTPGLIGLAQVNIRIPANIYTGTSTMTWTVNGVTSQRTTFATLGPGAPPANFTITNEKVTGAEGTDSSGNPSICATPVSKSSFLTTDPYVGVWFTYNNAQVGDVQVGSFIHPSGAVSPFTYTATFSGSGCTFFVLNINGQEPGTEPGNWQVKVTVNGVTEFTLPFTITSAGPPPTINSFTVGPTSVPAGRSATLSWSVSNATSVSINNGIGSVAASGTYTVAPLANTTYTITAVNSAGQSVSQSVTLTVTAAINVTLYITNNLIFPATISVNGTVVGSIAAGTTNGPTTQYLTVPSPTTMTVSYYVSGATSSGTPVGDPINAVFTTTYSQPTGNIYLGIVNTVGSTPYFAPVITNTSGTNLEMGVNVDPGSGLVLDGDTNGKCYCIVNSGAGAIAIGYYIFYTNSTVVAWSASDNPAYVGLDRYYSNITAAGTTGLSFFTFNVFP